MSDEDVYNQARNMIGALRVEPLSAFATENYLQTVLNGFYANPNSIVCTVPSMAGGKAILDARSAAMKAVLDLNEDPLMNLRANSLLTCYKAGFGMVDSTILRDTYVSQAKPDARSLDKYLSWKARPREGRTAEMRAYLEGEGAGLLADNLLESDKAVGTMLSYVDGLSITLPRVNGEEPYAISGRTDQEAHAEIVEGVLAALYLIREHHIAQSVVDIAGRADAPEPAKEPGTPPGYYLG